MSQWEKVDTFMVSYYIYGRHTYAVKITSLLRQNDVVVSFWRNNDVIIAAENMQNII